MTSREAARRFVNTTVGVKESVNTAVDVKRTVNTLHSQGLGEKLGPFSEIFTALKLNKICKVKILEWIWRLFESSEVIGRHLYELVLMSND